MKTLLLSTLLFLTSCVGIQTPRARLYIPANFTKAEVIDHPTKGVKVTLENVDMESVTKARWAGIRTTLREISQGGVATGITKFAR